MKLANYVLYLLKESLVLVNQYSGIGQQFVLFIVVCVNKEPGAK